jgi:hypothetical protein
MKYTLRARRSSLAISSVAVRFFASSMEVYPRRDTPVRADPFSEGALLALAEATSLALAEATSARCPPRAAAAGYWQPVAGWRKPGNGLRSPMKV